MNPFESDWWIAGENTGHLGVEGFSDYRDHPPESTDEKTREEEVNHPLSLVWHGVWPPLSVIFIVGMIYRDFKEIDGEF